MGLEFHTGSDRPATPALCSSSVVPKYKCESRKPKVESHTPQKIPALWRAEALFKGRPATPGPAATAGSTFRPGVPAEGRGFRI